MRVFRKGFVLAAAAAALALALTACSGSGGSSDAGGEPTTYQNGVYGFEVTYEEPLSQVNIEPSASEKYAVAFADKDGPTVDDLYANGVRVAVSDIGQTIKPEDVPKLQADITKVIEGMVAEAAGGKLTSEVTATTVNGTPGFAVDYQFTQGGETLSCRLTMLISGSNEFDLTEQTVASDWDSLSPTLDAVVQSFTLD
jgi:hypothetical protein